MQECLLISFIAQYLAISFYWLSPLQLYHKIDGILKNTNKSGDIVYLVLSAPPFFIGEFWATGDFYFFESWFWRGFLLPYFEILKIIVGF
jgi:hypothetical protein